ncbi:MAG TPA: 5-formyltetrahydrofolate cyclo-ligase [Polyangiaceae bacterium]|jgi:5-formyltetrahydrofolate cyclo-ligase
MKEEERAAIVLRAKAELRKRLRALRQTTPAAALAKRSERIVENLRAHEAVARASSVALFFPIEARHEVDLRALDADLRARGARVAYPSVDAEGAMHFRFATLAELDPDPLGFHGAPQTAPAADALDVIVVPALALDETGRRLGYGMGFFDRALPRFAAAKKIGVAYDFQLLVEVPVNEHDVTMDVVVTDARTLIPKRE